VGGGGQRPAKTKLTTAVKAFRKSEQSILDKAANRGCVVALGHPDLQQNQLEMRGLPDRLGTHPWIDCGLGRMEGGHLPAGGFLVA